MGRGKIEIKRIENHNNRQVTFSKRRNGLMKKANEIAVLCDAKVSVIIFASNGKMYSQCSQNATLSSILDDYHKHAGVRLWDAKHENINSEIERVKKENENMNIELKHLKGEDIQSMNHRDLMIKEDLLENGLTCVREKQAEVMRRLRERRDMLEAEHSRLHYELAQMELQGVAVGDQLENNGYHHHHQQHDMKDYNIPQMPFSFRVQPMQPNLQDHRM